MTDVGTTTSRQGDFSIDEFSLYEHPNESLRAPLTVLTILAPLAVLAEIYRFLGERKARLLTEEQWAQLGAFIGVDGPLVPLLLLAAGCLTVQVLRRHPWELPGGTVVLRVAAWALLWAVVRYAVGFTTYSVGPSGALGTAAALDELAPLAQVGLAFSGALQEELVFRAGLLGLLALSASALRMPRLLIYVLCIPLAAALFSLAHSEIVNHHLGAEPFTWPAFVHRLLAGLLYGLIFLRQGLAVVTLTHCFYNCAIIWRLGPWL